MLRCMFNSSWALRVCRYDNFIAAFGNYGSEACVHTAHAALLCVVVW